MGYIEQMDVLNYIQLHPNEGTSFVVQICSPNSNKIISVRREILEYVGDEPQYFQLFYVMLITSLKL